MKKSFSKLSLLPLSLAVLSAYAATPVNLSHQPNTILAPYFSRSANTQIIETNREVDANQTLHVRVKQMYLGHSVFGADAVIHNRHVGATQPSLAALSNKTQQVDMNGIIYQDLANDLQESPSQFSAEQAQKAILAAIDEHEHKIGSRLTTVSNQQAELVVYVDQANKAHWAYRVSFASTPVRAHGLPIKPIYILDANSFKVYLEWNGIETAAAQDGGGFGGNKKMGKLVYDGLPGHLGKLTILFQPKNQLCLARNSEVIVTNDNSKKVMSFACTKPDANHNNVMWDGSLDHVNGGFSPMNDALFGGQVIKRMYQDWYGVPVLTKNGKPMILKMAVHADMENAYWDEEKSEMVFGDGGFTLYPLTSLGVAAHEISHGFTSQHSNLDYDAQSGGMNEAFSDMAAQAAEFYAYGKNSWQIGPEIFKAEGQALRYMDQPSKDCNGSTPGNSCSIDDASQYDAYLDVHYSSGVYNRFFYLLSTTEGWDAHIAFDVMVQANRYYWTANTTFNEGACGVLKAADDLKKDAAAVRAAFDQVKVDYSNC